MEQSTSGAGKTEDEDRNEIDGASILGNGLGSCGPALTTRSKNPFESHFVASAARRMKHPPTMSLEKKKAIKLSPAAIILVFRKGRG